MSLLQRLKAVSTIKGTSSLAESAVMNNRRPDEIVPTDIHALNLILSGKLNGGFGSGITMWAGKSKSFKTMFALIMGGAYLRHHPDSAILFYDCEFGAPMSYFETLGIDPERVIHVPVTNVEEVKQDLSRQLRELKQGDRVFVMIDSIGNLASLKEIDDALDQKATIDMTRAKQLKSLFRIVTPLVTLKNVPLVLINHTYQEIGPLYPREIVSSGTGAYYSSENIYVVSRRQQKDGSEVTGFEFVVKVEKSRYVRERAEVPIRVSFEEGIDRWGSLFDVACHVGYIVPSSSKGFYELAHAREQSKFRASKAQTEEFWREHLDNPEFIQLVEKGYRL